MGISRGLANIKPGQIKNGFNDIKRVYKGTEIVWPNTFYLANTFPISGSVTGIARAQFNNGFTNDSCILACAEYIDPLTNNRNGPLFFSNNNGDTWTRPATSGVMLEDIVWAPTVRANVSTSYGRWVTVGRGGRIYSTHNGTSFTLRSTPTTLILYGVASDDFGWIVTVGQNGRIMRNTNQFTINNNWTVIQGVPYNTSYSFRSVVYGDSGIYVAVGTSSRLYYSTNYGATWSACVLPSLYPNKDFPKIAYGNQTYIALATDGSTLVSTNGINYVPGFIVPEANGTDFSIDIKFLNGDFYATVNQKKIYIRNSNGNWDLFYHITSSINTTNFNINSYNTFISLLVDTKGSGIGFTSSNDTSFFKNN